MIAYTGGAIAALASPEPRAGSQRFKDHWPEMLQCLEARPDQTAVERLVEGRDSGNRSLSPECARSLYDLIDLPPVTASSIRKTFTSRLDLWLNPILDAAAAESDFDHRAVTARPESRAVECRRRHAVARG